MGQPSLEEFRRWLQSEITALESEESNAFVQDERMLQLETALQEAMAFSAAWTLRVESSVNPSVREKSVRLLSDGPQPQTQPINTVKCNSCDAEFDDELGFCPVCGENR